VHARLQLALPAKDADQAHALSAAEARVPRQLAAQETARDVAITPVAGAEKPTWRLVWRGRMPARDLFAEAPDLFFAETRRDGESFLIVMADHPKDTIVPSTPVRFTLAGSEPVEFALHLDASATRP
jgi:hypothetical protein